MHPLRSRKDIHRTFQEGTRAYSSWAVLHARRRSAAENACEPRLGVVAGKSFRHAVPRNRARRLLRETARVLLGRRPAPWDLLLVARPEVLNSAFPERLAALQSMLRQVGVLDEMSCPA